MAGTVIPLFGRQTFDFSDVGASLAAEYPLRVALPVGQWTEGVVMVRIHSINMSAGPTISVVTTVELPSPDDPAQDFLGAETAVNVRNGDTAPSVETGLLPSPFGAFVRILIKGSQTASPATAIAELSAALSLKSI